MPLSCGELWSILSHTITASAITHRSHDSVNFAAHDAEREASLEGVEDENRRLRHHHEVADGEVYDENIRWCSE